MLVSTSGCGTYTNKEKKLNYQKTVIPLALGLLTATGTVSAAPIGSAIQASRHIGVYLTGLDQDYEETGTTKFISGTLDKETGTIYGGAIRGDLMWEHARIRFNVSYINGDTDYDGHLQNGTPATATTHNSIFDSDIGFGYGFSFASAPTVAIIPGVEAGYRAWARDIGSGPSEVDEEYTHWHYAGTLDVKWAVAERWVLDAGAAYGRTANPRMRIKNLGGLHVYDQSGGNADFGLKSKPWSRFSLAVNYRPFKHLSFGASVERIHYSYGKSNSRNIYFGGYRATAYEPDSTTDQTVLSLGVAASF